MDTESFNPGIQPDKSFKTTGGMLCSILENAFLFPGISMTKKAGNLAEQSNSASEFITLPQKNNDAGRWRLRQGRKTLSSQNPVNPDPDKLSASLDGGSQSRFAWGIINEQTACVDTTKKGTVT